LVQSSIEYDKGFDGEAKRLAHVMRTLLYDTNRSTSLLKQLGMKNIRFCCTCSGEFNKRIHLAGFSCLTSVFMGKPAIRKHLPTLESSPSNIKWVPFQKWWNKIVIVDHNGNKFSRQRLIRTVCNKDGGAHIDPELDKKYYELSRKNSLGWKYCTGGKWFDVSGPELASIRQMAHEIIMTLTKALPELEGGIDSEALSEALNPKRDWSGYLIREMILLTDDNKSIAKKYTQKEK